jgi:hypothetical protein
LRRRGQHASARSADAARDGDGAASDDDDGDGRAVRDGHGDRDGFCVRFRVGETRGERRVLREARVQREEVT